jgi:hypothetical protein
VPRADENGLVQVQLSNPEVGLGLRISFSRQELPYLFEWKMMGEGTYVLGIEPANCSGIEGRAVARERNDLPMLAPEESRVYELEVEVTALEQPG